VVVPGRILAGTTAFHVILIQEGALARAVDTHERIESFSTEA
jgi:hypothetical protein